MFELKKQSYKSAYQIYRKSKGFFPLIASVLLDQQNGVVFVDHPHSPTQVYVEHSFGFSQLFGQRTSSTFLQDLKTYLLIDRSFHSAKVRLYSPQSPPDFLLVPNDKVALSERQRFHLDNQLFSERETKLAVSDLKKVRVANLQREDVDLIEELFGVVYRFWRNGDDFIDNANPCLILYENKPAAICYSAATADGYAEIDVFSLSEYRNKGLAGYAVTEFIKKCRISNIAPLWDCFTNNNPSMGLARSVGFVSHNPPYPFFTINR